jgi:hypothetical protein
MLETCMNHSCEAREEYPVQSQTYEAREEYPVQSQTYEVTFLGRAGTTLRSEFDDCEVTIGPGTTTLRAELPDRAALSGLIERINSLGLDVIDVSLVAPPPGN